MLPKALPDSGSDGRCLSSSWLRESSHSLLHPQSIPVTAALLSPSRLRQQELVQAVRAGRRWYLSPLARAPTISWENQHQKYGLMLPKQRRLLEPARLLWHTLGAHGSQKSLQHRRDRPLLICPSDTLPCVEPKSGCWLTHISTETFQAGQESPRRWRGRESRAGKINECTFP